MTLFFYWVYFLRIIVTFFTIHLSSPSIACFFYFFHIFGLTVRLLGTGALSAKAIMSQSVCPPEWPSRGQRERWMAGRGGERGFWVRAAEVWWRLGGTPTLGLFTACWSAHRHARPDVCEEIRSDLSWFSRLSVLLAASSDRPSHHNQDKHQRGGDQRHCVHLWVLLQILVCKISSIRVSKMIKASSEGSLISYLIILTLFSKKYVAKGSTLQKRIKTGTGTKDGLN